MYYGGLLYSIPFLYSTKGGALRLDSHLSETKHSERDGFLSLFLIIAIFVFLSSLIQYDVW